MNEKPQDQNLKDSDHQDVTKELRNAEEAAAAEEVEVFGKLPPHISKQVEIFRMMAAGSFSQSKGISNKLTENHITKILELQGKQIDHEHDAEKQGRSLLFKIFIITAIFFLAIIVFLTLKSKDAILIDIIKTVAVFAGGFGAGMGAKSHFDKKK